jgi:cell division control protein 6
MKLGCSKCRYSKSGCTRCNIDKARNAVAKKEAELNDLKISQRAKVEAQLNIVRGFLADLEAAAGITSTKEAKTSSEQPPAKKQRQDQLVPPAHSNSVRHDIVTSPTPPRRLSPASAPIPQTVLLPQQQHQEEEGEEEVLGAATVAANIVAAFAANGMVGDVIGRVAVSAPVDVATTSRDEDEPVAAAAAPLNTDQQKEEKEVDWWNPLDNDRLQQVKTALHVGSVTAGDIPLCREKQAENLRDWLNGCFTSSQGGSCYISGVPGTGKSLTTRAVLTSMTVSAAALRKPGNSNSNKNKPPALISVNCMTLTEPSQVIGHILSGWYAARARRSSNGGSSSASLKSNEATDPIVYTPLTKEATTTTNNLRRMSSGGGTGSSSSPLEELQSIVSASQSAAGGGSGISLTGNKGRRSSAGSSLQPFNSNINNNSKDQNNGGPMMVVILDELDSLLTGRTGDALIEDLFCLAHAEGSRLVLIGIANSIDLVQQLMKPGGSLHKRNLRPLHLIFPAYLRHQFSRVLNQRLSVLPGEVFEPNTLEFCARKMANGAGDMRRALEACSRALQNAVAEALEKREKLMLAEGGVEQQQQVQALVENSNKNVATTIATPAPPTTTTTSNANPPRVGMRHMAAALSAITGGLGAENYNVKAIKQLPPQQQLLMGTAGKLMGETMSERGIRVKLPMIGGGSNRKRQMMGLVGSSGMVSTPIMAGGSSSLVVGNGGGGNNTNTVEKQPSSSRHIGEVTVGQLEEAHATLCRQVGMTPYTPSEFGTAISNLEIAGLLSVDLAGKGRNKDGKMLKVGLRIPEDDIILALADVPVLKNVIGC